MIRLPMSDYVSDYYKKQETEFTLREQAHLCWAYNDLLKDRMEALREILEISDDEKLNTEIRERMEYEEKAYDCFMTGQDSECIYIFDPDNKDEYDTEYFSSAENAISYGIRHSDKYFSVEKRWLFDRNPKGLQGETADDEINCTDIILSEYSFTRKGDIRYGYSHEYEPPFDESDPDRFEDMFLCIKSPFGRGDIVMGPDFDEPRVVYTDHNCFEELYERLKDTSGLDSSDNFIRIEWIGKDGCPDYDHIPSFDLWKVDSWDDGVYWEILQIMSRIAKTDGSLADLRYLIEDYARWNKSKNDPSKKEQSM